MTKADDPTLKMHLSPQTMTQLRARARKNGCTISGLAARYIFEALARETKLDMVAASKTIYIPAPAHEPSPIALFERGFTVNQIAAQLRKPYAWVYQQIGNAADRLVAQE